MDKIFQISGLKRDQKNELSLKIMQLGGRFMADNLFVPDCTHLIVPDTASLQKMTEKLFACLASRKWVLTVDYINRSYEANEWLDERQFERFSLIPALVTSETGLLSLKLFTGWNVLLHMSPSSDKSICRRILEAGGANITPDQPIRDTDDCYSLKQVTHVIYREMDPFSPELHKELAKHVTVWSMGMVRELTRSHFCATCGDFEMDASLALEISADSAGTSAVSRALVSASNLSSSHSAPCDQIRAVPAVAPGSSSESPVHSAPADRGECLLVEKMSIRVLSDKVGSATTGTDSVPDGAELANSPSQSAADSSVHDETRLTADYPVCCKQEPEEDSVPNWQENNGAFDECDEDGWSTCSSDLSDESDSETRNTVMSHASKPLISNHLVTSEKPETAVSEEVDAEDQNMVRDNPVAEAQRDKLPETASQCVTPQVFAISFLKDKMGGSDDSNGESNQMVPNDLSGNYCPGTQSEKRHDDGKRKVETTGCGESHGRGYAKKIKVEPDEGKGAGDHSDLSQVAQTIPSEMLPIVEAFCGIQIPDKLLQTLSSGHRQ